MNIVDQIFGLPENGISCPIPQSIKVPSDYAQLCARIEGLEINGFLEIIGPGYLISSREDWLCLAKEYWFWYDSHIIDRNTASLFTPIFHHAFGDIIAYCQAENRWAIMPRHSDTIFGTDGRCHELLSWIFLSGECYEKRAELNLSRLG